MLAAIPRSGLELQTPCARGGDAAAADAKLNVHRLNCGPHQSADRSSSPVGTCRLSDLSGNGLGALDRGDRLIEPSL